MTATRLQAAPDRRTARDRVRAEVRVAYHAHPDDAIASLTGTAPWPGPALAWVVEESGRARLAAGR